MKQKINDILHLTCILINTKFEELFYHPKNHIIYHKSINKDNLKLWHKKIIENFETKMPYCYFTLLRNNICNLSIIPSCKVKGYYDLRKTNIYYSDKKYFFHELNHMASSEIINNDVFSGFRQNTYGIGLNEAYTELITHRYNELNYNTYDFLINILSSLESIITKEKMEQLYYNADLKGLILEMQKYAPVDQIKTFISNIDYLYLSSQKIRKITEQKIIINKIKIIYLILSKMYLNSQIKKGILSEMNMKSELYLFNFALNNKNLKFKKIIPEEFISTEEIFKKTITKRIL